MQTADLAVKLQQVVDKFRLLKRKYDSLLEEKEILEGLLEQQGEEQVEYEKLKTDYAALTESYSTSQTREQELETANGLLSKKIVQIEERDASIQNLLQEVLADVEEI